MEYPWHHHPPPPPHPQQPPPPPHPQPPQPPPPAHHSLCPTCSFSHFPFCPPLQFPHSQNPNFQSQIPQFPLSQNHSFHHSPVNYSFPNPQIAYDRSPNFPYSSSDHGYKRPRPDESGGGDNERRLQLIRDHGGTDPMLPNGENSGYFNENPGFKRPKFDELGVVKYYGMSNLNTNYDIDDFRDPRLSGFHTEHDLYRHGYGQEPFPQTSLKDNYVPKQGRAEFYSPYHDNHRVLPMSSQVNPRNGTFFEHNNVGFSRGINVQPPQHLTSPSQAKAPSLFPIAATTKAPMTPSYAPFSGAHTSTQPHFEDKSLSHAATGFPAKEFQPLSPKFTNYPREGQTFPLISSNKPKAIEASHIFKQPHRATRPDHIVVILRGLPGSGKSYLAKMMRDLEVENGGIAPRIHSMDDYFMTEVEKVEESDSLKSSGSSRGKKPVVKMVMEYCYEAEMEEAYRSSMLKTFKKTLDEGAFPFVIVDDRNLRVADFAQFWATAKRSGYEVYLLEATYKDPAGCAARNVHGFTLDVIQKMADQWEEAPSMYLKLDAKSLSQADDSKENGIQEVDMDTDDGESEDALYKSVERDSDISATATNKLSPSGASKTEGSWSAESDHLGEEVKELGRSKWSNDIEDDDVNRKVDSKGNPNARSAMVKAYKKEGKSVHWGDQAANIGFSIGVAKRLNTSLVIGPGPGYNLKSNPLEKDLVSPGTSGKLNTQSVFKERIRAEHESFRAVFDRRKHRIGGLDSDEE